MKTLFGALFFLFLMSHALAQEPDGYYKGANQTSSETLRNSLHQIIDDHTKIPYTSTATDTWDVLEIADEDQDNPGNIITIYRNSSYPKQGGGNDFYNREHTWPVSYGVDRELVSNYPYSDMHALFLADSGYNSSRSNHPYNDCDATCAEKTTEQNNSRGGQGGPYPGDSNWRTGSNTQGRWETWPERKGDVARAQLYLDVRYDGSQHGKTGHDEPDLILTDDIDLIEQSKTGEIEPIAYMGMLSALLQWHKEDPVDAIEMQHHEAVALFQGNRNPFIDHPEWVACVFEGFCAGFQINAGLNDAWFNETTAGQGFLIVVFPDTGIIFVAWFTYDTERPPEDATAMLGEPGHRWLTAQGPYSGDSALLDIYQTAGGVFDSPDPQPDPAFKIGTMTIIWEDCANATLNYEVDPPGITGTIELTRIVDDNVALCQALNAQ